MIQLALYLFGERRPIAADDLHADELDVMPVAGLQQPRIALARAARAVTGLRQYQSQIDFLELELQAAAHAPAFADVACELLIERGRELGSSLRHSLFVAAGADKQAVRVTIEHAEAGLFEPAFRPQQDFLAGAG